MVKKFGILVIIFIILLGSLFWYANETNPYDSHNFVKQPYATYIDSVGNIQIKKQHNLQYIAVPQILAIVVNQLGEFARIVPNRFHPEIAFKGSEEQIIEQIHQQRFNVDKPYVISAGHFAELYVRNFGIFYNAIVDPRFAISDKDWEIRQRVTLQTMAVDLELLRQAGKEKTTFFPVSPTGYMGVNLYAEPSDSLHAIVWTLSALSDEQFLPMSFPASVSARPLKTQQAAKKLIQEYHQSLTQAINDYLEYGIDPNTGIIKKGLLLAGARDQVDRPNSFFDNVIMWNTARLGKQLGLKIVCPLVISQKFTFSSIPPRDDITCDFEKWKQNIITAFWDEKTGVFLDDLSEESIKNHIYSGDAFIVTSTQFLDFSKEEDKQKIEKEIDYVQKNHFDKPFPLRYAKNDQPERMHFWQRYFAPEYMGKTLWSHWGIEYIKTLILLSKDHPEYLAAAKQGLDSYKQNIEKYGGYPELYRLNGNIYQTVFYKSLLHAGWVVNYEQAKMMLAATIKK